MALTWVSCSHCKVHFQTDEAGGPELKCRACGAELNSGSSSEPIEWYWACNRQKVGPLSLSQLRQMAADGQLTRADMLLRADTTRWVPASSVPELFAQSTVSHHPDPAAPEQSTTPERPSPSIGRRSAASAAELPAVAGHEVLEVLGRGGMGVVYKARHVRLKRLVALKMILGAEHAGEHEQARFRAEAEAVARLQHPNIVQIHEIGEQDGRPFFALEFVDGGSLARKLARAPLPAREAARLIETLARAMHAAHASGIVHRDLKPANVLLTAEGSPKIADFGLAKQLGDESGQTQTGAIMGTPSYMAPEQAAGRVKDVGPSADVYALGAILYETLTGRPPFRGVTSLETLDQVLNREAVPPTQLQPACPRDLETICLKCLEKDAARRYASAGELADDLARYLGDQPIQARPASLLYRFSKFTVRRKALVLGAGGTLLMLLLAVIGTSIGMLQAQAAKDTAEKADQKKSEALAESQRQLANFLAASAGRESQHGHWESALALYDQALEKGPDDEIAVRLGRLDCLGALMKIEPMQAELESLAARSDLGSHRGEVRFLQARYALVRRDGKTEDALKLVREALAAGLNPGDEAHARALLATTVPEAIEHLQQAAKKGRFDSGIMDMLVPLLIMVGRFDEAQEYIAHSRAISPDSATVQFQEALLYALKDDMPRANALLERLAKTAPTDAERARRILRVVHKCARGDYQWDTIDMPSLLKALTGTEGLSESNLGSDLNRMLQLPFLRDIFKHLAATTLASVTGRQEARIEALAALVRIVPDGMAYFAYGAALRNAGRLDQAEEALSKAAVARSIFNARQRARFELVDLRLKRSSKGGKLDETRRRQLVADLRQMAEMGPLPPDYADGTAAMFLTLGESLLALQVIEDRQRRAAPNLDTLHLRVVAEFELGSFPRAQATCQEILRRAPNDRLATNLRRMTQEALKKMQGAGTQ